MTLRFPIIIHTSNHFICTSLFHRVKQYTWLLSGFNERRVPEKDKLSKIVGLYNLTAGVIATIGSVFLTPNVKILFPIIIIGHFIIAAYVNTRMV